MGLNDTKRLNLLSFFTDKKGGQAPQTLTVTNSICDNVYQSPCYEANYKEVRGRFRCFSLVLLCWGQGRHVFNRERVRVLEDMRYSFRKFMKVVL
jgi:hypothetical protein